MKFILLIEKNDELVKDISDESFEKME